MAAAAGIPVIDIRRLDDDPVALGEIDRACRDWGFFQIVGHGLSDDLLDATYAAMRTFFALPLEEKRAIERTATNSWGFYDRELTKNVQDWKQIFDVGPDEHDGPLAGSIAQWPAGLPEFKRATDAYYAACEGVSFRILGAIARNLGLAPTALEGSFAPRHSSFLRYNYYPKCDDPASPDSALGAQGNFGINHHTDAGALTILLQDDKPGLQVFRRNEWTLVEPTPGALVVNIGDIVQVWSNDQYPASLHRVIASRDVDRYSAPFFFNPAPTASYAPVSTVCSDASPARYRAINWGEFRAKRSAGDYADYGEEVQISHYRTGA